MANKTILVVGGGMSGISAALEASETGRDVYIVEKNPYLGGRVTQLHKYFPKLCPPNCGLEINFKRIRENPRIKFFTSAEVESITGQKGDFKVKVRLNPTFINANCTACGKCAEVCPVKIPNPFNFGMNQTKAAYLPHKFAFPLRYTIDTGACEGESCGKCVKACAYDAVDLSMKPETIDLNVGAIIWATGWDPYDASKISYYGFGRNKNVITNVMLERMAVEDGPTGGKIVRPSDKKAPSTIAFVQCAGSRDENHQPYCSQVCCLATLKQVTYIREQYPDAKIYIFYIDIRAMGKYEDFYTRVQQDENVIFIKGKVGEITEDASGTLELEVEDQGQGKVIKQKADLVVLATGMAPPTRETGVPVGLEITDKDGFVVSNAAEVGISGAGCAKKPGEVSGSVRDATAAALQAIQATVGGGE